MRNICIVATKEQKPIEEPGEICMIASESVSQIRHKHPFHAGKDVELHIQIALEQSGIDLPELLARVEYDHDFLREILEIFRQKFPPLDLALNDAAAREDLEPSR